MTQARLRAQYTRQGSWLLTKHLYVYLAQLPSKQEQNGDTEIKRVPSTTALQSSDSERRSREASGRTQCQQRGGFNVYRFTQR